jgi:SAM-dependent methyltransferase
MTRGRDADDEQPPRPPRVAVPRSAALRSPRAAFSDFVLRANRDKAAVDWRMHASIRRDLEARLGPLDGRRVLDVGCGYDYGQTLLFHSQGIAVTGIDIDLHRERSGWASPRSWVARLRRRIYHHELRKLAPFPLRFAQLDVRELDITHLPFPDAHFDAVISNAVFEHLMDVPAALDEIARVVAPGAFLRIGIHLFTSLSGPHNPRLYQNPIVDWPSDLALWYHLRGLPPAVPSHLNRWREAQYRRAFETRFDILGWDRALEGEHLLSPELAAELVDYGRDELLTRGLVVSARRRSVG